MYILGITTTRADFGLLRPTFERMTADPKIKFELVVTGTHLEEEFGNTKNEIENSGLIIHHEIPLGMSNLLSKGISAIYSVVIQQFSQLFKQLKPDLIFILGDRYETHAIATAATLENIAIAHAHGGEITEGAMDDALRHSITKLSHLHFASNEIHRNRIIQMGESPELTFLTGALAIESIFSLKLFDKDELERELDFDFENKDVYLVTFHPETLSEYPQKTQVKKLFEALGRIDNAKFIITKANADNQGREINREIETLIAGRPEYLFVSNLGQLKYFSAVKIAAAVIGNSSSGIIEVPSFNTGTVNIGNRQKGRLASESVIHCDCETENIFNAVKLAKDMKGKPFNNPYHVGIASEIIVNSIKANYQKSIIFKKFHNLEIQND